MLILHIIIAISSFLLAAGLLVKPVQKVLTINYLLIGATMFTGKLLVVQGYSALHVCSAGLVYTLAMIALTMVVRRRLALSV